MTSFNFNLFRQGIQDIAKSASLAIRQHSAILQEAQKILIHKQIRLGKKFRYVIIGRRKAKTDETQKDSRSNLDVLQHPGLLEKLALFLVEATRLSRKSLLPLLIAMYQHSNDAFLVMAASTDKRSQKKYLILVQYTDYIVNLVACSERRRLKQTPASDTMGLIQNSLRLVQMTFLDLFGCFKFKIDM